MPMDWRESIFSAAACSSSPTPATSSARAGVRRPPPHCKSSSLASHPITIPIKLPRIPRLSRHDRRSTSGAGGRAIRIVGRSAPTAVCAIRASGTRRRAPARSGATARASCLGVSAAKGERRDHREETSAPALHDQTAGCRPTHCFQMPPIVPNCLRYSIRLPVPSG